MKKKIAPRKRKNPLYNNLQNIVSNALNISDNAEKQFNGLFELTEGASPSKRIMVEATFEYKNQMLINDINKTQEKIIELQDQLRILIINLRNKGRD